MIKRKIMNEQELNSLKFPIGEFHKPELINTKLIKEWIEVIALFPNKITALTKGLTSEELNWKYRPEGWTIKQVVHHCADSHMNSLIRFKLTLTEDQPTIRPYFEDRWAELPDSLEDDIEDSLVLLKGVHAKLTTVMSNLTKVELLREYVHPEHGEKFKLEEVVGTYAWHSEHHLAHVKQAIEAKGKYE